MRLIREAPESEPSLVTAFQQSIAPACFGVVGYKDECARLTKVDAFGVTLG
jgi:hypothetical protein